MLRSEGEGGPPGEGEAGPPWKGGTSRERRGESGRERGATGRGGKVGCQGARHLRTVGRPRGGEGGERRGHSRNEKQGLQKTEQGLQGEGRRPLGGGADKVLTTT